MGVIVGKQQNFGVIPSVSLKQAPPAPAAEAPAAPKPALPSVEYVRARRKGSGWVTEVATIPGELIASGVVTLTEIGDWDLVGNMEKKLLARAMREELRR